METRTVRDASRTALLVAGYRARASAREGAARVCCDPWAAALAGDEGVALSYRMDGAFAHGELWLAVRTAFLDAEVRRLVAAPRGARQVVTLGAGLDTRAARLAREGVRFFEVDHAETQGDKLRKVRALAGYPVDAATYVTCDFETEDFLARLAAAGFRADEPAVIVWEGVTYYLPEPAVRATFRRVAQGCHPRTCVLADFLGRRLVEGRVRDPGDLASRALVAELGEPLRFGIDGDAVLPLLYEEGFRYARVTSFDEACLNLTGTYERARKFRFQTLALAAREAPGDDAP